MQYCNTRKLKTKLSKELILDFDCSIMPNKKKKKKGVKTARSSKNSEIQFSFLVISSNIISHTGNQVCQPTECFF